MSLVCLAVPVHYQDCTGYCGLGCATMILDASGKAYIMAVPPDAAAPCSNDHKPGPAPVAGVPTDWPGWLREALAGEAAGGDVPKEFLKARPAYMDPEILPVHRSDAGG